MRKVVLNVHLWIGLTLGLYFAFLGLTGSALVFKAEIWRMVQPRLFQVDVPAERTPLPLERLVADFRSAHPGVREFALRLPRAPADSLMITYLPANPPGWHGPVTSAFAFAPSEHGRRHDRHDLFVDPYTGAVLGDQLTGGTVFYVLHNLHSNLLLEKAGHQVHAVAVLFLLALVLTGLWTWMPRPHAFAKQFKLKTRIKLGAGFRRVVLDVHNVFGFYAFLVLFVIVGTATLHFWPTVPGAAFSALSLGQPARAETAVLPLSPTCADGASGRWTYEHMIQAAAAAEPDLSPLALDLGKSSPVVVLGSDTDHMVTPRLTTIAVDACTGRLTTTYSPRTSPGDVVADKWIMRVHFGQWGRGWAYYVVKALWCLAGLSPSVLFASGLMIYLGRRRPRQTA